MLNVLRVVASLVLVASLYACALSTKESVAATPAYDQKLNWLAGCWMTPDGSTRERWVLERGGYMFGFNSIYVDGRVVFFEQLRIEFDGADYIYTADPQGKGPTSFVSTQIDESSITFENADHDYPQRIGYALDGSSLVAEISMIDMSKPQKWSFRSCDDE